MNDAENFGSVIKKIRLEHGLTQNDVAMDLGVTPGYICNVENGRTAMSTRLLVYYAKLTNQSLDSLVGLRDENYTLTALDLEIEKEIAKLEKKEKEKLLKMLKIWNE